MHDTSLTGGQSIDIGQRQKYLDPFSVMNKIIILYEGLTVKAEKSLNA
jgi:hypothetical protein